MTADRIAPATTEPDDWAAVYVAHSVGTFGTPYERRCMELIRRLLPGVKLVDPAAVFASTRDWLEGWHDFLDGLDAVVVFADERGAIRAGCVQGIADAHRILLPVAIFDPRTRRLHRLDAIAFPRLPTPRDAGHPVAGEPDEPDFPVRAAIAGALA